MHLSPTTSFSRPRSVRIFRGSEFAKIRQNGRALHGPFFTLVGWKMPASTEPALESRLGVITSKKVGAATVRNRVRRRLKELHRLHRPELARGWWLVLIARSNAAEASWEELRTEWLRLARKLSILPAP